jgi:hypothetical protein
MEECIICFEPLENNIAILKCNHKYHFDCITNWINRKKSLTKFCPLCSDTENEIINVINVKINTLETDTFSKSKREKSCSIS